MSPASSTRPASAGAVRHFGRFQLLRLLGKSARSMLWLAADPRSGQDLMLVMPRQQTADVHELSRWMQHARRATRIDHPGLAHAVDFGEHERWPYIAYDRGPAVTLAERIGPSGVPVSELIPAMVQALQGLAFAHEAGVAHHDIQTHLLALFEPGGCRLMGLGLVTGLQGTQASLANQRESAERDVLAMGLVLHHGLGGQWPLDQADLGAVIEHMAPIGHALVRLGRRDGQPVPEALRAIVNRATDRQPRQRYRSARTFERAMAGWVSTGDKASGGPLALLIDRIRSAGVLPAMPGGASRAAQLLGMDDKRVDQLAQVLLQDIGLSFELLRQVNSASVRGAMGSGSGPILTVRRALALIGLDGVRRAARALRPWPGSASPAQVPELERQLELARHAGRTAQALRPAGYDAELVYLLALLQRLGRLVVQYHFPDEAAQIRRLMLPAPPPTPDQAEEPGMSEQAASYAVIGVDLDAVGTALAQAWGLDEAALTMVRRLPADTAVHASERDVDALRCTASCANEAVDALALPQRDRAAALHRVTQRYARVLHIGEDDLLAALRGEEGDRATADGKADAAAPDGRTEPGR